MTTPGISVKAEANKTDKINIHNASTAIRTIDLLVSASLLILQIKCAYIPNRQIYTQGFPLHL